MRRRWLLVGAALVVAVLAFMVLRGDDGEPGRLPLAPTTTRPDLSGVELPGVEGTTTSTVPTNVGEVSFTGVVKSSDGRAVPNATVRAEWFRLSEPQVIEVFTDEEGRFEIKDVAPGRWKIRAWRTPDFATGAVERMFVGEKDERELELRVEPVDEFSVTWDIETDPPIVDHNAELVVVFVERTVDIEGRTITTPLSDADVELVLDDDWQRVLGDETETTNDEGRITWVLRCREEGKQSVTVRGIFGVQDLDLAACIPISATTTTTTEAPEGEEGEGEGEGE